MEQKEIIQINKFEDKIKFLFYTNNNSLQVYLSKDSVVCNDRMETVNYDKSFSNYLDNGLLITHRKIPEDMITQNLVDEDTMKPIILELNFGDEDGQKIPALIIDEEYNARWSTIKEYNMEADIAAYIIGQIPFNFVRGIHFKSTDDCQNFNVLVENVAYPEDLYRESFEILHGDEIEINLSKIQLVTNEKLTELGSNISDVMYIVNIRDRIKAMFLSAVSSFEVFPSFYKINFDQLVLDAIGEKSSSVQKQLKNDGIYISDEEIASILDPTPFVEFIKIITHTVEEKDNNILWIKELEQSINTISKEEIAGYYLAIKSLANEDYESYNNLKWFENFKILFLNSLIQIQSSNEIIEKYRNKLDWLSEILDGKGKIAEFLGDTKSESKLLNGLILFVKDSIFNDSKRLMADMDNFKLSVYEKRMTWVLFGALKGTTFLSKEMKSDALLNRISDEVALILTATEYLISDVCSVDTYLGYRKIGISTILSKKGYPIFAEKIFNSEVCFKYINNYLSQKSKTKVNNKKRLIELLAQNITIPDKYYRYTYTLPRGLLNIDQDYERTIITSPIKAEETKEFSEEGYINQILMDFTNFSVEFEKQKENWGKFINILQSK